MSHHHACHECDMLVDVGTISEGEVALCPRCNCVVYHKKIDSIRRTKAVAVSGLLFYFPATFLPLMAIHAIGRFSETSLFQSIQMLFESQLYLVSIMVAFFCVITPLLKLILVSYLTFMFDTAEMQKPWYKFSLVFYQKIDSWEMLEVFMMGILVSVVKLAGMAELTYGTGLVCFIGLLLSLVALRTTLDKEIIWDKIHAH